ncbi:MAG: type II toxin-antitoxin system HigB family toxin [Verrucomicrobia bacterium]|nr:type II toxin-antitoxin system HigB family toxin [Verrucomicrobiota bacterium]
MVCITAIHYNRQEVFTLQFLTHADYDKDTWKNTLRNSIG